MFDFLFNLLIRLISGTKNAAYYVKRVTLAIVLTFVLGTVITIWGMCRPEGSALMKWLLLVPIAFVVYYFFIFEEKENKAIHTTEMLLTGSWTILALISGADWTAIICSSYLGNFLFNLPIQKATSGKWINKVSATDDPTGKTLGYTIFGKSFRVPRISNGYVRAAIALLFGLAYLINYFFIGFEFKTPLI